MATYPLTVVGKSADFPGSAWIAITNKRWGAAGIASAVSTVGIVKSVRRTRPTASGTSTDALGVPYRFHAYPAVQECVLDAVFKGATAPGIGDSFSLASVTWRITEVTELWQEGQFCELRIAAVAVPGWDTDTTPVDEIANMG